MSSNSDSFSADDDSDYIPSGKTDEGNISSDDSNNEIQGPANGVTEAVHVIPKRSRKRCKNLENWKRNIITRKRIKGQEYISNGKTRRKRECQDYIHQCRYDCSTFTVEERERIFSKLYSLPTYDLQTNFLASCVSKIEPKKKKAGGNKTFSTVITLLNRRVCRAFFLKTLDITEGRFKVICHKIDQDTFVQPDKRGKHQPKNKIPESARTFVIDHIKRFPRYRSHYSYSQNPNTRYLSPSLNIRKMHSLYKELCNEHHKIPVKESYYRHIFNSEFNLRFHYPHSDTCNKCDRLNNLITASNKEDETEQYKVELELHQRRAKRAVQSKIEDVEKSKMVNDTVVICFDLQKTLATPLLTTNIVFYLRQLWTYNFCIFNLVTGVSKMYVWYETVASRGSQEIGSCLLDFMKSLPPNITKVIAYSDACGGQNKNKNIAKLFMHIVRSTTIEQIDHKFFESGHSYMECDRSFALIEKTKKKNPQIFIPDHWIELIQKCSKKFYVTKMNNFVSFSALHDLIKDPKKDSEKNIIKWRDIKWFSYKKSKVYQFQFKKNLQEELTFYETEKCSKNLGRPTRNIILKPLYNAPLKVTYEKWENLQKLLEFIPPVHHNFFKDLPHAEKQVKKKGKQSTDASSSNTINSEVQDYVDVESD